MNKQGTCFLGGPTASHPLCSLTDFYPKTGPQSRMFKGSHLFQNPQADDVTRTAAVRGGEWIPWERLPGVVQLGGLHGKGPQARDRQPGRETPS